MTQEHKIVDCKAAREFVLAGNAYFTLRSGKTGTRYTYRVSKPKDASVYFVSCLYGPNNEGDYAYLGIIDPGGSGFRLTAKSRFTDSSPQVRAFNWVWQRLHVLAQLPNDVEFWHEGRCGRCGRMLTVPESIASGIGPECAKISQRRAA